MKIIPTFVEQNQGICTIIINIDGIEELAKIEESWNDPKYLLSFFEKNKHHLKSGYYDDYTTNEAVIKTIEDAQELFDQLYKIASSGFEEPTDNLSQLFKPLHKNEIGKTVDYQKCKAYGLQLHNSWLRLYAIRIGSNTFVITGGGIKLVRTMQEDKLLQYELEKLELTQEFLLENNILDIDDIENL